MRPIAGGRAVLGIGCVVFVVLALFHRLPCAVQDAPTLVRRLQRPVVSKKTAGQGACLALFVIGVAKGGSSSVSNLVINEFGFVPPTPTNAYCCAMNAETSHCLPQKDTVCGLDWTKAALGVDAPLELCASARCLRQFYGLFSSKGKYKKQLMDKNPHGYLFPHIARAFAPEIRRCGTKVLLAVRDPIDRLTSHFSWFYGCNLTDCFMVGREYSFQEYVVASINTFSADLMEMFALPDDDLVKAWERTVYGACDPTVISRFEANFANWGSQKRYNQRTCYIILGLYHSIYHPSVLTWLLAMNQAGVPSDQFRVVRSEDNFDYPDAFASMVKGWLGASLPPPSSVKKSKMRGKRKRVKYKLRERSKTGKLSRQYNQSRTGYGNLTNFSRLALQTLFIGWNARMDSFIEENGIGLSLIDGPWYQPIEKAERVP